MAAERIKLRLCQPFPPNFPFHLQLNRLSSPQSREQSIDPEDVSPTCGAKTLSSETSKVRIGEQQIHLQCVARR